MSGDMLVHESHLPISTLERIASGSKQIESRINDAKRRTFAAGDKIIFIDNDDESRRITAAITALHHYPTFAELFASHDIALFGEPDHATALAKIREFYSEEDEKENGVVGIEVKIV